MSHKKGPRLYLKRGSISHWIIRDGEKRIGTGCRHDELDGATAALSRYLAESHKPSGISRSSQVLIIEVLAAYRREREPKLARGGELAYSIPRLIEFWGDSYLSAINGASCRAYAEWRDKPGAARRDLETLRAAIGMYSKEYGLDSVPVVTLPEKGAARQRWLTRQEVAKMLWASRGVPHLSRFILVGLYTGTRSGALLGLSWRPEGGSGWVDLDAGVLYRRGEGVRETKKRQPPAPIPSRLVAHLRRWRRTDDAIGATKVIHYNGGGVVKLRRSWGTAREAAGLGEDVTPHTLRHTAATWLMQSGVDLWEAAGYLGMTVETLERVYGHQHHKHLKGARDAMDRRPQGQVRAGAREPKGNMTASDA